MQARPQLSSANSVANRPVQRPSWHQSIPWKWQGFLGAVAVIAAAAALRYWPLQALGSRMAWLTFYPAVMVAAIYGGLAAGLLATGLACLTATFLWPVLVAKPFINDGADWLGLAVFVVTGTMISSVAEAMLRANEFLEWRVRDRTAELEEASRASREAEERFRMMVDGITDYSVLMLDPSGHVASWNSGAERQKGYREEEIVGQPFSRFYADEDVARGKPALELEGAATTGRFEDEGWRVRKDGSRFLANVVITALRDEAGQLRGFAKITRDITERRQAQTALEMERAKLAAAFESTEMGLVLSNGQGGDISMNAAALKFHGYTSVEEMHLSVEEYREEWELRYPDGRIMPYDEWPLPRAIRGDYFRDHEIHYRNLKGGYEWVCSFTSVPVRNSAGEVVLVVMTLLDITARHRAETEIRAINADLERRVQERTAQLAQLKAALDEHAIVAITDARGKITYVNDKFCAISKYAREELLGQDHRIINSGHHPKAFIRDLWQTISSGRMWQGEIKNRAKDGTFYWVATTIVPFLDESGTPVQYIAIRGDITERKQAEEHISQLNINLRERAAQLEEANKELESFSYSVSHDLRAPLRHVHGYIEMLQRATAGQLSEKAQRYVKTISEASTEMGQLIDDLLAFSRMGRDEMRESRVDLNALAQDMIRELAMPTTGRNIVWQVAPLPAVVGDPSMLKQVLANLLDNAVKYSRQRDPARIEIGCAGEEDGRAVLFVRDNGAGFDMQYAHKLFGVFQRLHRAEEFEGIGIGLATIRRIVARHGGRVWADGALDQGATFYFTLQRAPSA